MRLNLIHNQISVYYQHSSVFAFYTVNKSQKYFFLHIAYILLRIFRTLNAPAIPPRQLSSKVIFRDPKPLAVPSICNEAIFEIPLKCIINVRQRAENVPTDYIYGPSVPGGASVHLCNLTASFLKIVILTRSSHYLGNVLIDPGSSLRPIFKF